MTVRIDPLWLAQSKFRRRHYEECVEICNEALSKNAYDEVCSKVIYLDCIIGTHNVRIVRHSGT